AQIAGQLTADATEKADIRCWRTLPAEIYIGSTFVKPGDYSASAESCGASARFIGNISVKAGQTVFVFDNTIY
ncbi:MAG: hypothetical protein MI742_01975, partial [Desulfobacterales bacterium]|nr:hypothetical protein [Desulfobacterales bacterium]